MRLLRGLVWPGAYLALHVLDDAKAILHLDHVTAVVLMSEVEALATLLAMAGLDVVQVQLWQPLGALAEILIWFFYTV